MKNDESRPEAAHARHDHVAERITNGNDGAGWVPPLLRVVDSLAARRADAALTPADVVAVLLVEAEVRWWGGAALRGSILGAIDWRGARPNGLTPRAALRALRLGEQLGRWTAADEGDDEPTITLSAQWLAVNEHAAARFAGPAL